MTEVREYFGELYVKLDNALHNRNTPSRLKLIRIINGEQWVTLTTTAEHLQCEVTYVPGNPESGVFADRDGISESWYGIVRNPVILLDYPPNWYTPDSYDEQILLEELKVRMHANLDLLIGAAASDPDFEHGTFAYNNSEDAPSLAESETMLDLRHRIDDMRVIERYGRFVVVLGSYTMLYDLRSGELYGCHFYHAGGSIDKMNLDDPSAFIGEYFAGGGMPPWPFD